MTASRAAIRVWKERDNAGAYFINKLLE